VELELEVGVMAADGERTEQDRRRALEPADAPLGEADGEMHGLEAAGGAQLDVLRGDPLGGQARVAPGDLVAEEVRQQRGASGDELGQAARMRLGDLDRGVERVGEVQQRRPAAEFGGLQPQALALGVGDVRHHDIGLGEAEIARRHRAAVHSVFCAGHDAAFCSPHTSHTKRRFAGPLAAAPSFAVLGHAE
jgi:hypothetical protein